MRLHAADPLETSPAVWVMNPDGGVRLVLLCPVAEEVFVVWVGNRSRRSTSWVVWRKFASHALDQSPCSCTISSARLSHISGAFATLGIVPKNVRRSSPP